MMLSKVIKPSISTLYMCMFLYMKLFLLYFVKMYSFKVNYT